MCGDESSKTHELNGSFKYHEPNESSTCRELDSEAMRLLNFTNHLHATNFVHGNESFEIHELNQSLKYHEHNEWSACSELKTTLGSDTQVMLGGVLRVEDQEPITLQHTATHCDTLPSVKKKILRIFGPELIRIMNLKVFIKE